MKNYKNIFIRILVVIAIFLVGSATTHAATYNNDLRLGNSGPDVVNLQTWLEARGYLVMPPGIAKGYFGQKTASALIAYQRSIGLPAYGFFGPLTRKYLNERNNNSSALQVVSPNGGEVWQKGTTQNISWVVNASTFNAAGTLWLQPSVPACAEPTQPIRCMIMVRAPYQIASVNLASGSYSWRVGDYIGPLTPGAVGIDTSIPDGQYKIKVCNSDQSICDTSNAYFNITSGQVLGTTPVISGLDAPTTLTTNQTGTWTVHASDPYNSALSYHIHWGDEPTYYVPAGVADPLGAFTQTTSFTHSYTSPGTYTVEVTVKNASGMTAQTTSTVVVTTANQASPLSIISPNGGEIWHKGATQNITWTAPQYFRATYADLKLIQYREPVACPPGYSCLALPTSSYSIARNISIDNHIYSWNVGNVEAGIDSLDGMAVIQYPPIGNYKIQICETGTSVCDQSDAPFTIASAVTNGLPDINITSPNGGEYISNGTNAQVAVNILGDSTQTGNIVNIYLSDAANRQTSLGTFSAVYGSNTFSIPLPGLVSPGQYKIYVTLYKGGVMQAYDYSDATFSVLGYAI